MNLPIGLNRMFAAAAARYGERPGLIDRRSTLSYAEAATQVAALADLIRALGPRPVVASLIDNSVEGVLLFAAISAAGGVNV